MIKILQSTEEAAEFAASFYDNESFSDPRAVNEDYLSSVFSRALECPESRFLIGIYREQKLTGVFVFLVLEDDRYLEMLLGLSEDREAYSEIFEYLKEHYPSYRADFVYNPKNYLIRELLKTKNTRFEPEQRKMILKEPVPVQSALTVVPYSEQYREGYCKIHDDSSRYWTAEKTIEASDRFRIFLALKEEQVVGYIDVTYCFNENEPYDLFVTEEYRRLGYGRALLAKAVEANKPNRMVLLVDIDNLPAQKLYVSMGFVIDEAGGSIVAHCSL